MICGEFTPTLRPLGEAQFRYNGTGVASELGFITSRRDATSSGRLADHIMYVVGILGFQNALSLRAIETMCPVTKLHLTSVVIFYIP